MIQSSLQVVDYSLRVNLGITADERATPQEVRFSLDLSFATPPRACMTDNISDTVCYFALCQALKQLVDGREFSTIEGLAQQAFTRVLELLPGDVTLLLKLHKVKPPIKDLLGGTFFELRGRKTASE